MPDSFTKSIQPKAVKVILIRENGWTWVNSEGSEEPTKIICRMIFICCALARTKLRTYIQQCMKDMQ